MKISKNAVFYNTIMLIATNISAQFIFFGYRIFLSRMIGAEGMGVYQLIFPFYFVLVSLTFSGLCMAVTRLSAERQALHDKSGIYNTVRYCIWIFVLIFAVVAIPSAMFSKEIAIFALGDERTALSILILLPCIFFTGFENIFKSCFYGMKKITPPIFAEITEQLTRFGTAAFLLICFPTKNIAIMVAYIVCGMLIAEIASSFLLMLFYRKHMPCPVNTDKNNFKMFKSIADIALPVSAAGLLNNLLSSANIILLPRRLVFSGMAQSDALSLFGVIIGMLLPLIMLPSPFITSLSTILMPKISEGSALKNAADIKRKTAKAIHAVSLFAFPSSTLLIVLAPLACQLLYKQTVSPLLIIPAAAAAIFVYFQIITCSILNGIGQQRKVAVITVIGGVMQLVLTYFAAGSKYLGIYGYLLGFLVSTVFMSLYSFILIVKKTKVKINWTGWFIIPILSSAICGLTAYPVLLLSVHSGIQKWLALILSGLSGAAVYYIIVRFQGLSIKRYLSTLITKKTD